MTLIVRRIAVHTARLRSKSDRPTSQIGYCLREVRECYSIGPRAKTAYEAWLQAKYRHPWHGGSKYDFKDIPKGVPIFWRDPVDSNDAGHIAIKTGILRPRCWSTDIRRAGYFDKVPIEEIKDKWGLQFLGWSEDLNGVKVYP